MNVNRIIPQFIASVAHTGHQIRTQALRDCVQSAMAGHALTVTDLGRGIQSMAQEKHQIKRADRLCSNRHLFNQLPLIYHRLCTLLVPEKARPTIHVDWSDLNLSKTLFLLRASLSFQGRALTLYEEVHPLATKEKSTTHIMFLNTLKLLLPSDVKPIIVTDAGFKRPWFKAVRALGWDFVGRIRGRVSLSSEGQQGQLCKTLFPSATSTPKKFINWSMGNIAPYQVQLVLYKAPSQGRIAKTAAGKRQRSNYSRKNARRARDPWLLATSLNLSKTSARKVINIYRQRMQIEESFRDHKSSRFGLGMEQHRTKNQQRMSVLVLMGTLAHHLLIIIGFLAEQAKIHWQFQANTIKTRKVLSYFTLGVRLYRSCRLEMVFEYWEKGLIELREKIALSQVLME